MTNATNINILTKEMKEVDVEVEIITHENEVI